MNDKPQTTTQTHQETLRLLLNSDTSPCLYAHEVAALQAAIAALGEVDALKADLDGAAHKMARAEANRAHAVEIEKRERDIAFLRDELGLTARKVKSV